MKKIFLLSIIFLFCYGNNFSQTKITVNPFLGEKLTPELRERYNLFAGDPVFEKFSSAEFWLNSDSTLDLYVSRAKFSLPDTIIKKISSLENFRKILFEKEIEKRISGGDTKGKFARIFLSDGGEESGELVAIRDSGIVLRKSSSKLPENDRHAYIFVSEKKISSIEMRFPADRSKTILYTTIGALSGFGIGFATRYAVDSDGTGANFSAIDLLPALLGASVGYFIARSDESEVKFRPADYNIHYLLPYSRYFENEPDFLRRVR